MFVFIVFIYIMTEKMLFYTIKTVSNCDKKEVWYNDLYDLYNDLYSASPH